MAGSYRDVAGMGLQAASHASIADLFSNYKYQQTFGLLYLNRKKADIADVRAVLDKLSIENSDVKCVQRDTEKWWSRLLLKLEDYASVEFDRIKDMDGEIITLRKNEEDVKIMIQDMTSNIKYVAVAGVPFEVPDNAVYELMSRFGIVKGIRMNYYQSVLKGIATGTCIVKMSVKRNIPSVIEVGSKTLNISYDGQTKTCYKCGKDDHLGEGCTTLEEHKVIMFNDTDYPVLNSHPGVSVGVSEIVPESTDPVVTAVAIPPVSDKPVTTVATISVVATATAAAATPTSTGVVVVETTTATPAVAASTSVVTATITPISAVIENAPEQGVTLDLQDDKKEENIIKMDLEKNENKNESTGKEVLQASAEMHETPTLSAIEVINDLSEPMSDEEEGLKNLSISPIFQCAIKKNPSTPRKGKLQERQEENIISNEELCNIEKKTLDPNVKFKHIKESVDVKKVDDSFDSQMIPCNQLANLSNVTNKRLNVDNQLDSNRSIKGGRYDKV